MAKKLRRDPVVHELLNYFRERIGGELDGYFGPNYDACLELIERCKSKKGDPLVDIKALIDISVHPDNWHSRNATNFRYLLNNARKIANTHRTAFRGSKLGDALRKADEHFSGGSGSTSPDHP